MDELIPILLKNKERLNSLSNELLLKNNSYANQLDTKYTNSVINNKNKLPTKINHNLSLNESEEENIKDNYYLEDVNLDNKHLHKKPLNSNDNEKDFFENEKTKLSNSTYRKETKKREENKIKIDFANTLLENKNLLESIDEDALLATVKFLFEIKLNKKCVKLSLKSLKLPKFEKIQSHLNYIMALCYYARNKPKMAAKHFNISIADGIPFTSFYYIGMDIIEKNLNSYESCLAYIKLIKRRKQLNPECIESRIRLSQFYSKIKDINNAIIEYEELYDITKSNEFLFNLCFLYTSQKSLEKLSNTFLRLARNIKHLVFDNSKKIIFYRKEEKEDILAKSIKYYIEAFKLNPKNIEVILELSEIHRAIDNHKEALGFIDIAMKIDKNDYRIYYEGFLIYEEIGDMHTAKEMIKLCLINNISFIKGYNTIGNLLRKEKLYDEAVKIFSTALTREPENVQLLNNLDDYNRAIEHILKANKMEPHNPQVLSILSSIYRDAGWYNISIKSCLKALEHSQDNTVVYIQLAQSYKANRLFKEAKDCCLKVLETQPKLNEAYLIYLECILNLGEWKVVEANKENIRILVEFQLQKNIINTNIPALIADYLIDELALKAWVFNKYAIQDYLEALEYLNSDKTSEEEYLIEIPKCKKIQKKFIENEKEFLNVGFIVDKIEDFFTFYSLLLLRSKNPNVRTYIIAYEINNFIKNFCETAKIPNKNVFIIAFDAVQHPLLKSESLKSLDLDIIIFFENFCSEIYDNLTLRKIYQFLAYKPAPIIICVPYNAVTRSEKIFDYAIIDKSLLTEENRLIYQENLIVCDAIDLTIKPDKFWTSLRKKDFANIFLLNQMNEKDLKNEIGKYRFPNEIYFGNLSNAYKINEKIFTSWCKILLLTNNTKLIMKYSNDLQVENFKANAEKNQIADNRLVFIKCNSKDNIIDALKAIDIYLDIDYLNSEDGLIIALLLHVSCVCFAQRNDNEKILNNLCLRYLANNNLNTFASNYQDYENLALEKYESLIKNELNVGYTRLKKIELINNLKDNFKYMESNPYDLPEPCGDFPYLEIYKQHYENNQADIYV